MSQKRRKADSGKAIGEMSALRWEPTHVTKPNPRVVPLYRGDGVAGTLRCWLCLGGCPEAMTSGEQNSQKAGYDREGRLIGWLSTGIVQGSVLRILICCKGDWGTRLQENPQLILQFVIIIQLTSRRILRD